VINLPNFLSFGRLLSVPLVVFLVLDGRLTLAFWLFIAAGVTDALDGFLAKRLNARTTLGAYLDPLADKALLVGIYITLGWTNHIPPWLVILVAFRDLTIVGGALLEQTITQSFKSKPMLISKINTALQIALAGWVLAELGLEFDAKGVTQLLVLTVAATTILSGLAYLVQWTRRLGGVQT
jgi:cardiolipin synthase